MNISEASAVNKLARWILDTPSPGGLKASGMEARQALEELAERSFKTLSAGVTRSEVRSHWPEHEVRLSPLVKSLAYDISQLTKDGERDPAEPGNADGYVMENDDAVETLHTLISEARSIFGLPDFVSPGEPLLGK